MFVDRWFRGLSQEGLERTVNARVADLSRVNADLLDAKDKALEASRAKSEFLKAWWGILCAPKRAQCCTSP